MQKTTRVPKLMLSLALFCSVLRAQIITTVAGTTWAPPASGVPALKAPLGKATGVAMDALGNIYIADDFDNVVAQVSTGGIFTIIAGNGNAGFSGDGGPAVKASLSAPWGVAVDYAGNVYIADSGNNRIRKVSGGIITTVAGDGTAAFSGDGGSAGLAQLYDPTGVAVDASGNLYIADFGNNRIRRISGGTITTVAGSASNRGNRDGLGSAAWFNSPAGIAVGASGILYVADTLNATIRGIAPDGTVSTLAGMPGVSGDADGTGTARSEHESMSVEIHLECLHVSTG